MNIIKTIFLLTITILQANAMSKDSVKSYMKKYLESKMDAKVKHIDMISTYPIADAPGWDVYFLTIKVNVKMGDKYRDALVNQTVFAKGNRITLKLMKKGKLRKNGTRRESKSYADLLKPIVPSQAYDDAHFLLGNKNAPHKILLFSDPFCGYCAEKFPEILDVVKKNPRIYGLYYYHLPLTRIHPASAVVTKVMHLFHQRGEVKKILDLYSLDIDAKESNVTKILKAIEKKTGDRFTKKQLDGAELNKEMKVDMEMKRQLQVTGTPTIFLDGKWDRLRKEFGKYAR
jgi:protein-disulfide isomerase